jgi:ABC-type transporter Mla subunit MlaD
VNDFVRTSVNLAVLAALTIGLILYAGATWARDIFFDDRYPVTIALPETGGVVEGQEIAVLGHAVGRLETIELTPGGVAMEAMIDPEESVPQHAVVQIIRRSAIGEQTINLIPVEPGTDLDEHTPPRFVEVSTGWEPLPEGEQIAVEEVKTPTPIPVLLENLEGLFRAIPKPALQTAITELGTAVGGRGDLLVEINREAAELNEVLVEAIPDFERLVFTSEPITRALSDHNTEIADMVTHLADLSAILGANRPQLEALIDDGTATLRQTDALIRANRANLSCLVQDFGDFNQVTLDNGGWLAQLLDLNRHFFGAVDVAFQWDPYRPGYNWVRVGDLIFPDEGGEAFEERRPTPPTLPGAACVPYEELGSPFGVGAQAVRQPDHQPPDPTSPGIFFAPLVDDAGPAPVAAEAPPTAPRTTAPLPVTGGGAAAVLAGALAVAAALTLRRRR